jgi:hydroxyacylglutathione hydrolase
MFETSAFGPIHVLRGPNMGRYPYCHSVFLETSGILIDPASERTVLKSLKDQGKVKMIWLTHWHEDHLMHLDLFDDLPLWMGKDDAPPLGDLECFLDWYDIETGDMRAFFRQDMLDRFHFRPRVPNRLLNDGETIQLPEGTVEICHTPGHTPGHLAYYFRDQNVLFMGDYDLTPFGPWYGDLYSDIDETINSVNRLRSIPADSWVTCHETGVFMTPPGEIWDRYLSVIDYRERRLLDFLQQPRTMAEIVDQWITYGKKREPLLFYRFGEQATMKKHLERLVSKGIVRQDKELYRRL